MEHHSETRKKISVNETAQLSTRGNKAGYLQDNRPQSSVQKVLLSAIEQPGPLVQQPVYQLQSMSDNSAVMQLARTKQTNRKVRAKKKSAARRKTISGHGGLRRDPGGVLTFTVPHGKSVTRPAPPGATLGNLSMLLNTKKGLTKDQLRKQMKVSTTPELWNNKAVVGIIEGNATIAKTPLQQKALQQLLSGTRFADLDKGLKLSLASLERKSAFEKWSHSYVKDETFKTYGGGQPMEDMHLTPFEDELRSKKSHNENEYVENPTTLSDYVAATPGVNDYMVNACSYDTDSPFTGFQIDHKKDK